jgi:hypothetical protein
MTKNGTSYEVFGTLGKLPTDLGYRKKSERNINSRVYVNYEKGLGAKMSPSRMLLIADGDDNKDDPNTSPLNKINNWPEAGNNHGAAGACLSFCDGHAEFIPISIFLDVWNAGSDGNRTKP